LETFQCSHFTLGIKRFAKSLWKSFKVEFAELEENLIAAREEIKEEIQLASEQAAHGFRRLQLIEIKENQVHRSRQVAEVEENKKFRSQQILVADETRARQIQKLVNNEGNPLYSDYGLGHN
jgi:hypothetical protein